MKITLIREWRKAWRFLSVIAATMLAVLSVLQSEVLPLFQFAIPERIWPWVTACFGVAIVALRVIAQPGLRADDGKGSAP
jgi:hypothetical protein